MKQFAPNTNSVKSAFSEMAFVDHLRELRKRLFVSMVAILVASIVCFIFYENILAILSQPFENLARSISEEVLFINTLFEGFLIKVKVALISGAVLSFPVHLFNIIKFVFPGLLKKERKVIAISLATSFVLIVASVYYGYFKVIPISVRVLTSSGFIPRNVGLLLNYGKNIFYIFQFLFITVILFQLPIALEILLIMNVVKRKALLRSSRYVIVGVFLLAAALTPPDFISQITLALPLVLLFFVAILIAKIAGFGGD